MPTTCEQKLNGFKLGQAKRMSAIFEDLSFKVSRALYGKNQSWQKQEVAQRIIDRRITEFKNNVYKQLETDIRFAFNLSNACGTKEIAEYTKGLHMSRAQKEVLFARNFSAVSSFMSRKTNGFTLSDRVWNLGESTKGQINNFIEGGLLSGKSAVRNAKDLKQFLKEPDKQFRRVKALNPATGKRTGKLVLSNPAKNYNPGRGVYRSSFKNALRLSRNEVNMAYKTADIERYRRLPFVKGYEVHLSNSHPIYDICDELAGKYPKNFTFTGWHPNCLCFVTPVQISKKDFKKYLETGKVDPGNYITNTPKGLGEWVNNNSNRVKGWKSKPYFIADNFKETKDGFKLLPGIGVVPPLVPPVPRIVPPTPRITPPISRVIPKTKPKQVPKKVDKPKVIPKEHDPVFIEANKRKNTYEKQYQEIIGGNKADIDIEFYKLINRDIEIGLTNRTPHSQGRRIRFNKKWASEHSVNKRTFVHEIGHQIHMNNGWATYGKMHPEVTRVFEKYKKQFSRRRNVKDHISEKYTKYMTSEKYWKLSKQDRDMYSALSDTVGSLSRGRFGGGHSKAYYNGHGGIKSVFEFMAHAFENRYLGNEIFKEVYPEMYKDMIDLIKLLAKEKLA